MSTIETPDGGRIERTTADLAKAAVSGWLGTALEFMDFQLYSLAAALVFKDIFFPTGAPGMAVILAMATYGVGYISRPVGAFYFGRLGDRIGRRKVLFYTIALMGAATTLIGVLPTYQQVGILAPALLVALRLVQGFGAGAEIAGASVMLTEYAPRRRRGIVGSLVALGTNSGTLGASAIWGILVAVLSKEDIVAFGWRIPFIASIVIMGFAVWVRLTLKESPVFEAREDAVAAESAAGAEPGHAAKHSEDVLAAAIHERKGRAFFEAFFLRFGQAGNSGMIQTYLISYITATLLLAPTVGTQVVIFSSLCGFVTIPVIGFLSDKFGRKLMYMVMSSISLVLVVPMIAMIATKNVNSVFAGYIIMHQASVLALASLENLTMSEIFGSRHRYTQIALAKELAAIIATGIGPVLAAALVVGTGGSWWPIAIMIAVFTAFSLAAAIAMPEVAGRDLTVANDCRPGEALIGPFARRDRARLGLPSPDAELAALK